MIVVTERSRNNLRWLALAIALLLLLSAVAVFFYSGRTAPLNPSTEAPEATTVITDAPPEEPQAEFAGSASCAGCHAEQYSTWKESQHAHAMAHATGDTVLADFNDTTFEYAGIQSRFRRDGDRFFVTTDGPDGRLKEYEILYTFGIDPLQQYLVDIGGRIQVLPIAWDTRAASMGGQRWFHLYPDEDLSYTDALHWTGANQNWNFMCAECHVTDYRKGYNSETQTYSPVWSELGIGCEGCHGPGSSHLQWAETGRPETKKGLTVLLDERRDMHWLYELERVTAQRSKPLVTSKEQQVCAQCHSLRSVVAEGYHAGLPLLDFYRPELLTDPLYFADGQQREEVFISGSFAQSKMHEAGVTCSDCHDPHGQQMRAEGNALCTSCHLPDKFDRQAHHFHASNSSGAQCVNCHMPETTYMVIDPRRDHSIRIPRPDLSVELGTPDACTSCHTDRDSRWAAEHVASWFPEGRWHEPTIAGTIAAADQGVPAAQPDLAELVMDRRMTAIVRASAAARLQPIVGSKGWKAVTAGLQDERELVRLGSMRALEDAPAEMRLRLLAPLLTDPLRSLRATAASLLADVPLSGPDKQAFDRALMEYEQELILNADRAGHLGQLAMLRLRQGRSGEAEEAWDRAIKIEPLHVGAYLNLADMLRGQGREKTAEKLLREAWVLMPEEGLLPYALGMSLVRQQQSEAALQYFRSAWELLPEDPRTGYIFAVALEPTAPAEAMEVLSSAVERHPYDRDLLWAGASFALRHGKQELVGHYIEALLKRDSTDEQAIKLRRLIEQGDGRH